jgi:hypothetical protein
VAQALRCPRKCGTLLPGAEMLPPLPNPVELVNSFRHVDFYKRTKIWGFAEAKKWPDLSTRGFNSPLGSDAVEVALAFPARATRFIWALGGTAHNSGSVATFF